MLWYRYNKIIIIVTNAVVLEFLIAQSVLPGTPQLAISPFLTRVRT